MFDNKNDIKLLNKYTRRVYMALQVENNFINTSYYKQNKKAAVPETSFESQLNNSQKKLSVDKSDTANLRLINNTGGYRISNNYSNETFNERKSDIDKIKDFFNFLTEKYGDEGDENSWYKLVDPNVMNNVLNLQIENNKDTYFTNGKININKIAEDCGISLSNATPLEIESIRQELYEEKLITEKESDALNVLSLRCSWDTAHETGTSDEYAYKNIRFNFFEKANYYKKLDLEYNTGQAIRNLDDIVLNLVKK